MEGLRKNRNIDSKKKITKGERVAGMETEGKLPAWGE